MQTALHRNGKVIVGLGQTGLSFARYLQRQGESFRIVDSRQQPPGLQEARQAFPQLEIELGEFQEQTLLAAEELLVSPGVDLRQPVFKRVREAKIPLSSDIGIFAASIQAPIAAITGSNAKSTVVSLLGAMAEKAGLDVAIAGNIGKPVLDLLAEEVRQLYILEISSFQLESTHGLGAEVACILNISSDHMDRYDHEQEYLSAKQRIFQNCKQVVVNRDDPLTTLGIPASARHWSYGLDAGGPDEFGLLEVAGETWLAFNQQALMSASQVKLAGRHNLANALAALALGHSLGLDMSLMQAALSEFAGLPHRCQFVAEIQGVKYYNDSKGTNVGASIAALHGLGGKSNVILLAGGQGKGADFCDLQESLSRHGKMVIVYGEDAERISQAVKPVVSVKAVDDLLAAVALACQESLPGDIVLLSPACASFDMFMNFEDRGRVFMAAVEALQ
jgi:UDP-N-acetylmuramoylalanine--D-glutamate ligase